MIDLEQLVPGGDFHWSLSKHDTYDTCKRKYFYQYYGAWVDPELDRLKKLSALPLWAGVLVHDTIETYLKTHDTMATPEEQEALIKRITHGQMPQDWDYSLAGTKKFRLFEHEYSVPVDEWRKRVVLGIVITSLRNFFKGPIHAEMYAVGKENWLTVEDRIEFDVAGVNVVGRMDAAYRQLYGRVRIVDWKTGLRSGTFNKAQLAGYALYAFRKGWAKTPDEITTTLAYLALDEYKDTPVTWDTLKEATAFVEASAKGMKSYLVDPEKNVGRMGDFPQINRKWTCERCQFRKACWPAWGKVAA